MHQRTEEEPGHARVDGRRRATHQPPATAALIHTLSISPYTPAVECSVSRMKNTSATFTRLAAAPPRQPGPPPPGPADPAASPPVPRPRGRLVPGLGPRLAARTLSADVPFLAARPALLQDRLTGKVHAALAPAWSPPCGSGARLRGRAVATRRCGAVRRPAAAMAGSFRVSEEWDPQPEPPSAGRPARREHHAQDRGLAGAPSPWAGRRRRPWTAAGRTARLGHGQAGGQHGNQSDDLRRPGRDASAHADGGLASPVATSSSRLSTRSATRPVQRTSSTGAPPRRSAPPPPRPPPAPRCCKFQHQRGRGQESTAQGHRPRPAARYTSPHPRPGRRSRPAAPSRGPPASLRGPSCRARPAPVARPRPGQRSCPPEQRLSHRCEDMLRSMSFTSVPGKQAFRVQPARRANCYTPDRIESHG